MIGISRVSGVLTHIPPDLRDLAARTSALQAVQLHQLPATREHKTTSACGVYACKAFEGLGPVSPNIGLVCISGATGAGVKAFDNAWRASEDGTLTGVDFARRAKKIHPFTLVRSLQNQTPAVVSMAFGVKGPCLNALDSATAISALLPNIDAMLNRCPAVALVMASAGDREEEQTKVKKLAPSAVGLEGALCFLLTRDGALGYVEPMDGSGDAALLQPTVTSAPTLTGGLAILQCMAQQLSRARIVLDDFSGYRTFFEWRNTYDGLC